jgi:hypothetical protein
VIVPSLKFCRLILGIAVVLATLELKMAIADSHNSSFENLVMATQIERSSLVGEADIVIVSDSSPLMRIDDILLKQFLGNNIRVENFVQQG